MDRTDKGASSDSRSHGIRAVDASREAPGPGLYGTHAQRAASSDCTVLITGETGVGKGHFARWLHANSSRANGPFIPVNCGAIPESIIDSQLFGHARGAFSGATTDHLGLVRAADQGTLFLDEVGELPATAQMRLLRLLQEREVQPVGYSRPIVVDVRVISATNTDLQAAIADRRFREDLHFRLDVVTFEVPPLRERQSEIAALADRFNQEFASLYRQEAFELDAACLALLERHMWPGNIRQLRTVMERLHVLCAGETLTPELIAEVGNLDLISAGSLDASPPQTINDLRERDVRRALAEAGGNVSRAAVELGVHRSTIYRWLRSFETTSKH